MAAEETGLPIAAAAEMLGIHPRTLRRYISDGRLRAIRYTTQVVRIQRDEIEAFLEGNIRVETGTGTCYVPRQPDAPAPTTKRKPAKAAAAHPRVGHFG